MQELSSLIAKPHAMLPANIDVEITSQNTEKLKELLKTTKFIEIAESIKACVKQSNLYNNCFIDLKKIGAVLPESDTTKLNELTSKISEAGTCIATCFTINLIVNNLTPVPPSKSRAAFVREYEHSLKGLKFDPSAQSTAWLQSLLKAATSQEARPKMAKPKMSPKKRTGIVLIVLRVYRLIYIYIYIYIYLHHLI